MSEREGQGYVSNYRQETTRKRPEKNVTNISLALPDLADDTTDKYEAAMRSPNKLVPSSAASTGTLNIGSKKNGISAASNAPHGEGTKLLASDDDDENGTFYYPEGSFPE